ncbi:hypothetical protein CC1G_10220 [Coprinopsis cinerea okayama7|uniref:2OGFeDO JBP1/TET oxygenase domain-containing protein n=1 Tax=Coprinopsis cinerea (strain Okayama-7 / 130 / ATCC MYA-4618 / FGSC 9003) TaxID=240176 RepID=A8NPA0_COPC7|nr:hypothetical protein CC1G_10220 [Coprinopsis cinerea okayama7\|eukprot:XP_001835293.2 hypothetical protein CC1G_10220 [Coprinopsis cinerea okayama7\
MSPIVFDLHHGGRTTEAFGRHCQYLLRTKFDEKTNIPKTKFPLTLRAEARQIVNMAHSAFGNRAQLKWSFDKLSRKLDELSSGQLTPEQAQELREAFEPLGKRLETGRLPCLTEPVCFVDSDGVIGFWSFPNAIQRKRQDILLNAVQQLSRSSGLDRVDNGPHRFFHHRENALGSGEAELALCTVPDGAKVPTLSQTLLGQKRATYIGFLEEIEESFAVLGGILAVTHPWLFDAALAVLSSMEEGKIDISQPENLHQVLTFWSAPFTKFKVVTNRETVLQRNLNSPPWTYDLVWTGGTLSNGRFECPSLGYRFINDPGTVFVGLLGILEHGIALGKSEQVQFFASFEESILKHVPQHYIPKAPTVDLWRGYWYHK